MKELKKNLILFVVDEEYDNTLSNVMNYISEIVKNKLHGYYYVFTESVFQKLIFTLTEYELTLLQEIQDHIIVFPSHDYGGVILYNYLVIEGFVEGIIFSVNPMSSKMKSAPMTSLLRQSNLHFCKHYFNLSTFKYNIPDSIKSKNVIPALNRFHLKGSNRKIPIVKSTYTLKNRNKLNLKRLYLKNNDQKNDIAIISHNALKDQMVMDVSKYLEFLTPISKIYTTGGTGKQITSVFPQLSNVYRYNSGPLGGDAQISTEVLFGNIKHIFFYHDQNNPHAHAADIFLLYISVFINDNALLLTSSQEIRQYCDKVNGIT